MSSRTPAGLTALVEYLKRSRGFDFAGYKPASLERRIQKRMVTVGVRDYPDYVDYLEVHPEEFEILFNTILINVTAFFRDGGAWDVLSERVVPELLTRKPDGAPVRVWSAGCASGEEAYTLAMILAEAMGAKDYKERVKIYATDIDEEALARARQATYDAREIAGVPQPLLARHFEQVEAHYTFSKDLRRNVIFGRHDLIQDAPISRVDLLVCRNTLMYFNAETQSRILTRFHFGLNDGGVLFLGRAETLLTHASTFAPLDLRRRISTKVPRASLNLRERLLLIAQNGPADDGNGIDLQVRLRESALESAPIAQLVVDVNGGLVLANERARSLFSLSAADLGRPIQDLKISYRPVEIRSCIDQAYTERVPIVLRDVEWIAPSFDTRWLDVQVVPLIDTAGVVMGAAIAFADVSVAKRLQRDLEHANQELETAYEELQSTNEELETTNEELQSTVEELETTNEELQSTNEELETMNEELQSTNEELQTINEELRQRSDELNTVNAFLESILTSLRGGVAVVDAELKVLVWNDTADDLWGIRADEAIGHNLLGLDIGLPVERIKQPMRECLTGNRQFIELQLEATNRKGRAIDCRVTCSPLLSARREIRGVIVMMEDLDAEDVLGLRRDGRARRESESRG
ncbi:MAG TPA: CheR family methyltransferase [Gemmatimonadaceae bacterium]|jgi:two-component system CheB/CheR fusion protein